MFLVSGAVALSAYRSDLMRHMNWLLVLLLLLAPAKVAAADDHASATAQSDVSLISAVLADVADNSLSMDEESDGPDSVSSNASPDAALYQALKLHDGSHTSQLSRFGLHGIRAPPVAH